MRLLAVEGAPRRQTCVPQSLLRSYPIMPSGPRAVPIEAQYERDSTKFL